MRKANNDLYVCAVIQCNGLYFVIRGLVVNGRPTHGFFFPGCKVNPKYPMDEYLRVQLYKKYNIKVVVNSYIGEVKVPAGDHFASLHGYYCQLKEHIEINQKIFDYRWNKISDILNLYLESADRLMAERVSHFWHVYEADLRTENRSVKETSEALFYFDSLVYFRKRLPDKDMTDFNELIRSGASIEEVRLAYKWLLKQNSLDYNEYLDYIEMEKRSKALGEKKR